MTPRPTHPPWGDYRFTDPTPRRPPGHLDRDHRASPPSRCGRARTSGSSTSRRPATGGAWATGPGMIVTHAHPAYLYGGGAMLQGTYEYFGMLSLWVPPPDTDELAEQAVRFWTRVTPDIPFMGFATGRFIEVAAKLGIVPRRRRPDRVQGPARLRPGRGACRS